MKRNRKNILVYAAVFGLLLFLHYLGFLAPAEKLVQWALGPVLASVQKGTMSVSSLFSGQNDVEELKQQVKALEEENQTLITENVELGLLRDENAALREHLLFQHKNDFSLVMANVVARGDIGTAQQRSDVLTIDRGSAQGLREGLAVLSGNGVIVGKINQVGESVAEVEMTNNPGCRLAARVMNQERTTGIVQGDLGLTLKMDYIPQSVELALGDTVVTSGLEENIPTGLVIGKITKIKKENNDLWQSAVIEPIVDPNDLMVVAVVK